MRQIRFGWPLLVIPLALSASACADTEKRRHDSPAGDDSGGAATVGGNASGGSRPASRGGEPATQSGGEGGSAGEPGAAESGAAGEAGAPQNSGCEAPTSLSIVGDYTAPNGDELWLRDSGKAVTLTRVPAGTPASARPPALWQVVRACPESALLLKDAAGSFTRLDYVKGATSLTACLSRHVLDTVEQAERLPPADRANTIDAGCNDGPWTRFAKGEP